MHKKNHSKPEDGTDTIASAMDRTEPVSLSWELRSLIENAVLIARPNELKDIEETGKILGLSLAQSAREFASHAASRQRSFPMKETPFGDEHLNPEQPIAEVAISLLAERDFDRASIRNSKGLRKDTQTGHRIADLGSVGVPLNQAEISEAIRILAIHALQAAMIYLPNHRPESPLLQRLVKRFKAGDFLFRSIRLPPSSISEFFQSNPEELTYVGLGRSGLELRVETSWRNTALITELRGIGQIDFGDRIVGFRTETSEKSAIERGDFDQGVDIYLSLNSRSLEELVDRTVPFNLLISRQITESILKDISEIDTTKSDKCAFVDGKRLIVDVFKAPGSEVLSELDTKFKCEALDIQDARGSIIRSTRSVPLKSPTAPELIDFLNDNGFALSPKIESKFGVKSKRRPGG